MMVIIGRDTTSYSNATFQDFCTKEKREAMTISIICCWGIPSTGCTENCDIVQIKFYVKDYQIYCVAVADEEVAEVIKIYLKEDRKSCWGRFHVIYIC